MKGRKAIPNKMKEIRGTNQLVRMRKEIEVPTITKITPPKVLKSRRARKIFTEKSDQLIALNILTDIDLDQLAIYANSLDMLFEAIENINMGKFKTLKNENGEIIRYIENPYLKLYRDMVIIVNKIGSEFGFSPVSRQKIQGEKEAPKNDPFDDVFNI